MPKIEYYNPNPYKVVVVSTNGTRSIISGYKRAVIEEAASIEPADSLKIIRRFPAQKVVKSTPPTPKAHRGSIHKIHPKKSTKKFVSKKDPSMKSGLVNDKPKTTKVAQSVRSAIKRRTAAKVGHRTAVGDHASNNYKSYIKNDIVTISKNIAIGILSYNRLECIKRLLNSIRAYTDLRHVTLFISDESSDSRVKEYLKQEAIDFVLLDNDERLGVAGNSNRLLKCMSRFNYCFLLNDDVEILNNKWIDFYIHASEKTGIQHFCYRQPGLIGATLNDGESINKNGIIVNKIEHKPHGAIMFYTNAAFAKVGYFDESWGEYGMEHVDWSNRVGLSGLQNTGYYDVQGSHEFLKIHAEQSAIAKSNLKSAKIEFDKVKDNKTRIHINHSPKIKLPSVSYVIPVRDIGRSECIKTVINNIRSQKFPVIEITLVEEDNTQRINYVDLNPIIYRFVKCKTNQQFNKSKAFNTGVLKSKYDHIILHDADILVSTWYTHKVYDLLQKHDGVHIGKEVMYFTEDYTKAVNKTCLVDNNGKCNHQVGYFEGGSLACTKATYMKIGGFNEDFEGYGCEDCDFFKRLLELSTPFYNNRSEIFYHLHHGRVDGWQHCHARNKELIRKFYAMKRNEYVGMLKIKLNRSHD